MAEIRVPTLGELVTEATIGKWFKKAGDVVAVDEPLVELETDKVTIEVPAPAAGVLPMSPSRTATRLLSARSSAPSKKAPGRRWRKPRRRPRQRTASRRSRAAAGSQAPAPTCRWRRRCARSRPRPAWTRRAVPGTGKDGRVTKGDMLAAIERAAAQPTPVPRPPQPCRSARPRRPTMPRARSACA